MNKKINETVVTDIVKYPILTDKTTQILEDNKYSFIVEIKAKKSEIKEAIEKLFDVQVEKINTLIVKPKKKRIGKYIGYKNKHKKAIVQLNKQYKINLFLDN
uniref:ribosomal protein L23 n=1 Tax=Gracilaria cliftonii TaxID=206548 RepID=UPI001D101ABA|nr:ribosomal protein L23 [Gracilaria cliftonii]UAD84617.1 ribosomal protein L23 [Gracilaria cliftonii]